MQMTSDWLSGNDTLPWLLVVMMVTLCVDDNQSRIISRYSLTHLFWRIGFVFQMISLLFYAFIPGIDEIVKAIKGKLDSYKDNPRNLAWTTL